MTPALIGVLVAGGGFSIYRWIRVSQREHYVQWSVMSTALRWLRCRPPNRLLACVWLGLTVNALTAGGGISSVAALCVAAVFPVGMPVIGSPPLRLTSRAVSQGVAAIVCASVMLLALVNTIGANRSAAISPLIGLACVELGGLLNKPLQRRRAMRFRREAEKKLRRIAPRVVAITGSYGKTTVKNHLRDLTSASLSVFASPASWNNEAGLCRAINEQLPLGTEVFIAEMGTYGAGEIRNLVGWLKPEISVITAIAPVHLERMGSLENITAAKSEIVDGCKTAVINIDYPHLDALANTLRTRGGELDVWTVGTADSHVDVRVMRQEPSSSYSVLVRGEQIGVASAAVHPGNVACAVAIAHVLGVSDDAIGAGLHRLQPIENRAATATMDGVFVIDDTFNSNPDGAKAALRALIDTVLAGRRAVVTPGMVELGPLQYTANEGFARAVRSANCELVIVGWTNRRSLQAGHPEAVFCSNRAAARLWVRQNLTADDGVLWENDLPDHYP